VNGGCARFVLAGGSGTALSARDFLEDLLQGKNAFVYAGRAAQGKCSVILEFGPPAVKSAK